MRGLARKLLAALLMAGATAGLGAQTLSLDKLKQAQVQGIRGFAKPVTLSEGRWQGAPVQPGAATRPLLSLIEDFAAHGDLDGDGRDEAVVVLQHEPGGSGRFVHLAVFSEHDGQARHRASLLLGDRVQVRDLRIEAGRLVADLVEAGAKDPACCPSRTVRRSYALTGTGRQAKLQAVPGRETSSTLSVADLAGPVWVLTHWRLGGGGEAVDLLQAEAAPTLSVQDGRLHGFSGCNRFNAALSDGAMPGEFTVGAVASTRRACLDPGAEIETRFLGLLPQLRRMQFAPGVLMLQWQSPGGEGGVMRFVRQ